MSAHHSDPAAPAYGFVPRRTVLLRQVRANVQDARLLTDMQARVVADSLAAGRPTELHLERYLRDKAALGYARAVADESGEAS